MKELAIITRVDDRERNEYIQRRLVWKITDEQMTRLSELLEEIRENEGNHDYPKPELFGADGEVTFEGRELEGMYAQEPTREDEVYRNNVSLMDYLIDWKGERHDRYAIVNGIACYDENGKLVQQGFGGFLNW